jgi:hypothetical protein
MFDLPTEADPGPSVTNFRFEKVNAVTDTKDIVGKTHIFRVEPSGGDWWVPSKSYFRARLNVTVGFNNSRYPAYSTIDAKHQPKDTAQPTSWPLPPQVGEIVDKDNQVDIPIGKYLSTTQAKTGKNLFTDGKTAAGADYKEYQLETPYAISTTGLGGESLGCLIGYNAAATNHTQAIKDLRTSECNQLSQNGIQYFRSFKPFTALKFVEVADAAVDAFFDQMSFSVGPTRVETVLHPQLVSVMNKRTKFGAGVNATRFDTMGVYGDEQSPGDRYNNRHIGKTSVFDILGYSNIVVSDTPNWEQEYQVSFDVLYVPPLSVFELPHALPSARYELEFKGVSNHQIVQNNFFHVTMPGGTGRWFMNKESATDNEPGKLNVDGPAKLLDGKHRSERTSGASSLHPAGSIFVYEPPICAGPKINEISVQAHYMGRGMIGDDWLNTLNDRRDPGNFISVACTSLHLEAAMATGPVLTDSTFVLQFDQTTPHFLPLTGSSTTQSLIFDVDPMANHFMFGFRQTNVDADPCLQQGHLVCPANVERDLIQYYISFDMKTRPTNFATDIDLTSARGAVNEMVRSQINNMTLYANTPETLRSWLKKGPYYAYDWPRDGTSNATRFQLNMTFCDPTRGTRDEYTMGPHGQFENEMPLVYASPIQGWKIPSASVIGSSTWIPAASGDEQKSNAYKLDDNYWCAPGTYVSAKSALPSLQWKTPRLWYSLYYPANYNLLRKQVRIDAVERCEPTRIRTQNPEQTDLTKSPTVHDAFFMLRTGLESAFNSSHFLGSVAEHDRHYKGTEANRPTGLSLANANHSCVLFQSIPRKFIITTAGGRVIAVRTIDNRI